MTDTTNLADRLEAFIPRGDGYNSDYANTLTEAVESLRSVQSAQVQGWKLVPVKATIEMVEAGYEALLGQPDRSRYACVIEQYDAMLAAAPSAPAAPAIAAARQEGGNV